MSYHISGASFSTIPSEEQYAANRAAQSALNFAIGNVPDPSDITSAHDAAAALLSVLSADPSEQAQREHRNLVIVMEGMQSLEEIDAILQRTQDLVPPDLRRPTALELVHDTALRENLARMLGGVKTFAEWQTLTRRLTRRLLELQPVGGQ